jgi:2-polyprenyl-3-methyl-5-hydroxy-6-metoxy-1,4-benzoquinol methylase
MTECPVCRRTQAKPFLSKHGYEIVRCLHCQTLYVSPPPAQAELARFYNDPSDYKEFVLGHKDYLAQDQLARQLARQRLDVIDSFQPRRGCLLDLGCGAGFFLDEAKQRGWQVSGTEWAQEMLQYASSTLNLHVAKSIDEFEDSSFDVVTMWEYIEHLPNPLEHLEQSRQILKPQGLLCISTPNTAHWQVRLNPGDWWEFKPPAHLTFFTPTTLRHLVESAGYTVLRLNLRVPLMPISGNRWASFLQHLRGSVGDRIDRTTPLWWVYTLARQLSLRTAAAFLPRETINVGIDLYARKVKQVENCLC